MNISTLKAPIGKTYLPYQIEGIKYALSRKNTLIADEMGLGKTIQAIGILNNAERANKILVVCPASLIMNWWREIDEWLIHKPFIDVVSYGQLHKVNPTNLNYLIVDEAHYCKNEKSKRTQEIKRIAKFAEHVIKLTGTPTDNRILELWPLLQILDPDRWDPAGTIKKGDKYVEVEKGNGAGFWNFARRYCDAKKVKRGHKEFWDFSGASNIDRLNKRLRETVMVRRMKSDVLNDLPPKTHQIVVLPETINEYVQQAAHSNSVWGDFDTFGLEEGFKRLRANKIAFEEFSEKWHEQGLEKCEFVIEHVERLIEEDGRKIILFGYHIDVIEKLHQGLKHLGCAVMTAKMSPQERDDVTGIFKDDPNCKIILGSIGVMGVGFNLTESSTVVFAEVSPVPGKMAQATDRAHRIGQRHNVLAHYLVQDGSIDARICKLLVRKMRLTEGLNLPFSPPKEIVKKLEMKLDEEKMRNCSHESIVIRNGFYCCKECGKRI